MDRLEASSFDRLRSLPVVLASVGLCRIGKCKFSSVIISRSLRPKSSYSLSRTRKCPDKLPELSPTKNPIEKFRTRQQIKMAKRNHWNLLQVTTVEGKEKRPGQPTVSGRGRKVEGGKGGGRDPVLCPLQTQTDTQEAQKSTWGRHGARWWANPRDPVSLSFIFAK